MSPLCRVAVVLAGLAAAVPAGADEADPIVAEVGPMAIRVGEVARRLAAMPSFQFRALGTPTEARRSVLDTVLVRELLYSQEAERRGFRTRVDVRRRLDDGLKRAFVASLREVVVRAGVPEPEVRAYYESHRADYEKPERLRLSRILVADEGLARKILAEARAAPGGEAWNRLAREHSVDGATKMRGGNLGFVHPNGHTDVPQLEVDRTLYEAASKVKDGQFVGAPVKEGARFAIVWRRGTVAKVSRSFEDERMRITDVLTRTRLDTEVAALVQDLQKRYVSDVNPALLESLPGAVGSAALPRPAGGPPGPRPLGSADPVPRPVERSLR